MASSTHSVTYSAEEILFQANLREFGAKASNVCCLGSSGKLDPSETYARLADLWGWLERSRAGLRISDAGEGRPPAPPASFRGPRDDPDGPA